MAALLQDAIDRTSRPLVLTQTPEDAWALVAAAPTDLNVLARVLRQRASPPYVLLLTSTRHFDAVRQAMLVQHGLPANTGLLCVERDGPEGVANWLERCILRTESTNVIRSASRILVESQPPPRNTPPPSASSPEPGDLGDAEDHWLEATDAIPILRRLLQKAEQRARIGHWFLEIGSQKVAWSPGTPVLLGLEPGTSSSMDSILMATHPEDRGSVQRAYQDALQGVASDFQFRIVRPDGAIAVLDASAAVETDAAGRPSRVIGTLQDVTAKHHAEEQARWMVENAMELERLESMQEFKQRFLQTIAHELNTPLTPIRLQMMLAEAEVKDLMRPSLSRSLRVIRRNVGRLESLVSEMLDSVRIQDGRVSLSREWVDVAALAKEAVEAIRDVAKSHGTSITCHIETGEYGNTVDARRIGQVLDNLLSNAVKYSPSGGQVTLSLARHAGRIEIAVEDEGIGMDAEAVASLFEPFARVHDQDKVRTEGTGLGLYICKGLVEAHGGALSATSAGPGKGSRFVVRLPVRRPEEAN